MKAVADGNANAVDKALEALTEFLTKASEQHVVKWVWEVLCDLTWGEEMKWGSQKAAEMGGFRPCHI